MKTNIHYNRILKKAIEKEIDNNKILIITGPRQSGKTTLLRKISENLESNNKQIHYYNFDRVADLDFFNKQQKIEAFLKIRSLKQRMYIFIDEVQRKKDAGNFFKFFYDEDINAKFIFSGSSSVELTSSFGDALTGRKRMFTLLPLNIEEIASTLLKEEYKFAQMKEPQALNKMNEIIDNILVWGSYPEVTQKALETKKMQALSELYESYVQKDVKDLLRVKNIKGFNLLVKYLAHSVGEPLVIEDLVRQTNMHAKTVNSYLDILEGTLIIARIENFNPEFEKTLPKSTRYFFIDNGMRNYVLNQLNIDFRTDYKKLAANLVYTEIRKFLENKKTNKIFADIFHYQTYSDNHIDFIISSKTNKKFLPILIRYPQDKEKLGKKGHEYINTRTPDKLIIITKDLEKESAEKNCLIKYIPLNQFLCTIPDIFKELSSNT